MEFVKCIQNKHRKQNKNGKNKNNNASRRVRELGRMVAKNSKALATMAPRASRAIKTGRDIFSMIHPNAHPFLMSQIKPFSDEARGSWVGDEEARPSYKFTSRARASIQVAGGARTIIFLFPTAVSDRGGVYMVSGTPANLNLTKFNELGAGLTHTMINLSTLPQTHASFYTGEIGCRCSSMAVKLRYTGPITSRGGTIYFRENYEQTGIYNAADGPNYNRGTWTTESFSSQNTRILSNAQGGEHEFVVHPQISSSDWVRQTTAGVAVDSTPYWSLSGTALYSAGNLLSGSSYAACAPIGAIVIDADTAQLSFILEIVQHCEYTGEPYNPIVTPSPPAVQDHNAICAGIHMAKLTHNLEPEKHTGAHIVETLKRTLLPSALRYSEKMVGDIMKKSPAGLLATGLTSLFL